MYKVIGAPATRLVRVTWMLEELGAPYEIVNARPNSEEAFRHNPSGRIPVLLDGDIVVSDSAAICVYLCDRHPEAGMAATPGTPERAQIDSWLHFAQSELEAPLWIKLKHRAMLPEDLRLEIGPWTAWEFTRDVRTFEARLGQNTFAIGDRFTAADVVLGHIGAWARAARFQIGSPTVNAYLDRVLSRPALARAKDREAALRSRPASRMRDAPGFNPPRN